MKKKEIEKKVDNLGKRVNARIRRIEKKVKEIQETGNCGLTLIEDPLEGYDPYNNNCIDNKERITYSKYVFFTFADKSI